MKKQKEALIHRKTVIEDRAKNSSGRLGIRGALGLAIAAAVALVLFTSSVPWIVGVESFSVGRIFARVALSCFWVFILLVFFILFDSFDYSKLGYRFLVGIWYTICFVVVVRVAVTSEADWMNNGELFAFIIGYIVVGNIIIPAAIGWVYLIYSERGRDIRMHELSKSIKSIESHLSKITSRRNYFPWVNNSVIATRCSESTFCCCETSDPKMKMNS